MDIGGDKPVAYLNIPAENGIMIFSAPCAEARRIARS
jgi:hypothetical protein